MIIRQFLFLPFIFFFVMLGVSRAEWPTAFDSAYKRQGLDVAILTALSKEASLSDVVVYCTLDKHLEPVDVFTSLYCAKIPADVLVKTAELVFIPKSVVFEAFQKSITECD